ncbi:MAG: hypothetical protein U0792_22345 [Gemmataceae bacterium]
MTEKQWLRSANAEAMNTWYGARHTERKARLLMLAACQQHPAQLRHESVRFMVELLVAHYADPRSLHEPFTGHALAAPYRQLQSYASSLSDNPERGVAFGMVAAAEPAELNAARDGEEHQNATFVRWEGEVRPEVSRPLHRDRLRLCGRRPNEGRVNTTSWHGAAAVHAARDGRVREARLLSHPRSRVGQVHR